MKTSLPSGDAVRNSVGKYYRPGLDVVRLIAFLMVFLSHALPLPGDSLTVTHLGPAVAAIYAATQHSSKFGLCLFFTLSAFLIFELLLRERQSTGTANIPRFYVRRILRIWPLYYLGLSLGVGWAFAFGSGAANLPALGWFAVFAASWFVIAHGWMNSPADVLWSISVEEQFYLVAPWLAKYCSRRALFSFCVFVMAVSNFTLYVVAQGTNPEDDKTWPNSFVQFECFAAGILLCLCLRGRIPKMRTASRVLAFSGAALSWLLAGSLFDAFYDPRRHAGVCQLMITYALAALGSGLVLFAMLDFKSARYSRWAVHLGRISYGLYVFHVFVIELFKRIPATIGMTTPHSLLLRGCLGATTRIVAPLLATWGLAEISYRLLERPFLRLKTRFAVIDSRPPGTTGDSAGAALR